MAKRIGIWAVVAALMMVSCGSGAQADTVKRLAVGGLAARQAVLAADAYKAIAAAVAASGLAAGTSTLQGVPSWTAIADFIARNPVTGALTVHRQCDQFVKKNPKQKEPEEGGGGRPRMWIGPGGGGYRS